MARAPKPRPERLSKNQLAHSIPAAALFSFLKETRGLTSWTTHDLAKSLKIGSAAAKQALAALEMQGYIKAAGAKGEWLTTEAGEVVSGSKFPRYGRESIEQSLASFG
jgi:DNA-binding transcriptional regulator YhcF (GntR family)